MCLFIYLFILFQYNSVNIYFISSTIFYGFVLFLVDYNNPGFMFFSVCLLKKRKW